ncbi:hypothetical protein [Pseudomonas chlororaphis]|uniref:hypothetical protein n=1 Tax=Pseudomonas chlororaphis TaxID=587753 RepID=UPI000F563195|nr:hypothetical protein [Pseudomonas chlororaphis]AZD98618.1 hypothetical protein C4K12_2752 [Pseudomonas chlororaphis subsp. aureofaciens]QHC92618.1 hypothetical protein PchlR47_31385 [Pseudomonas chlororaphis]
MESLLRILVIMSIVISLSACFDRSISGSYVAKDSSSAELLQLTQAQDGKIVGTLQHIALKSSGGIETTKANVSGVADGESLTLSVSWVGLPISRNLSGTVTASALELNLAGSAGTVVSAHFARGSVADFNSEAERLVQAGQSIKAEKLRADQVETLDRSALALEKALNAYVKRARKQIDDTPRFISYFTRASNDVSERLRLAQRLSSGNGAQRAQAEAVLAQISASEPAIRNTGDSIDTAIEDMAREEASLNIRMMAFTGNCLSTSTVKPGDVIPNMGPCKGLEIAAARFGEVKGLVHAAHERLQLQKNKAMKEMEATWLLATRHH